MTLALAEACDLCGGEGTLPVLDLQPFEVRDGTGWLRRVDEMPCPRCCCTVCGSVTDTPPVCLTCEARLDAEFERRQDMAEGARDGS